MICETRGWQYVCNRCHIADLQSTNVTWLRCLLQIICETLCLWRMSRSFYCEDNLFLWGDKLGICLDERDHENILPIDYPKNFYVFLLTTSIFKWQFLINFVVYLFLKKQVHVELIDLKYFKTSWRLYFKFLFTCKYLLLKF